jgi:hypothetical protein
MMYADHGSKGATSEHKLGLLHHEITCLVNIRIYRSMNKENYIND